ncbi:hypothetical protein DB30_07608 [Enhygromyxa salina]|uniref:Uncharacterized protein n=1 Tax=Enhygromyxa salina TaxID=215803 RepID=A0A0C2D0V1_9BACT|nr:hypothetical protein [Enhygromyxa salina]KIG13762.1 hypothetical protein DB30_07608 [Enhygromyxa salina]
MADTSPKPASRGGSSRLRVIGRLTALAGVPLLVIFLIFASGVYFGASRSYRVQTLEANWLGLASPDADVDPPVAAEVPAGQAGQATSAGTGGPAEPDQPDQPDPDQPDQPLATGEGGEAGETGEPQPLPQDPPDPPDPTVIQAPASGLLTAVAEPVGSELRSRFDETRLVRVKILVDPALVIAREDWLSYVASLTSATHASFELLFGVDVQLQGVVVWDLATNANVDTLLAALATHDREGADVILGLLARPQPAGFEPSRWIGAEHGDHALVFADLAQTDRFYRNMLRALAGLLGAEPVTQLDSFMSDATSQPGTAPTIDPDNRGKVVFNKRRPFASSAAADDGPGEAPTPNEPTPKKPKPKKPATQPEPSEQP